MAVNKPSKNRIIISILAATLVVATVLRFYKLNEGLWLDEIITYVKYARLSFLANITTFDSENQHFLYSLLSHLSFSMFGESNWALRLPAALFGIGSIAALFLLGRELSDDLEAILAAALLTFSYHHVWFSQNARGYTGLLFWTILSSWLFVCALKDNRIKTWLFFAASEALGVYTHLTMVFVIIGHFIIYLFIILHHRKEYDRARWIGFWIGFGGTGLLLLLLFAPVIPQILGTVGGSEQSVVSGWKNPLWTALEILKGLEVGFTDIFFVIGALVLFGIGLLNYARSKPVLLGLFILPSLIGSMTVVAIGHHLWPRFFFFAVGFGALIVVRGIIYFGQLLHRLFSHIFREYSTSFWMRNHYIIGTLLCVGLIIVSAFSIPHAYGPKQDYAGAKNFIDKNLQPGDKVVTVSLVTFVFQNLYQTNWIDIRSLDELNKIRHESKRTWLIYSFPSVLTSVYPDIMTSIKSDFGLIKQLGSTVEEGNIYIYRVDNSANSY